MKRRRGSHLIGRDARQHHRGYRAVKVRKKKRRITIFDVLAVISSIHARLLLDPDGLDVLDLDQVAIRIDPPATGLDPGRADAGRLSGLLA